MMTIMHIFLWFLLLAGLCVCPMLLCISPSTFVLACFHSNSHSRSHVPRMHFHFASMFLCVCVRNCEVYVYWARDCIWNGWHFTLENKNIKCKVVDYAIPVLFARNTINILSGIIMTTFSRRMITLHNAMGRCRFDDDEWWRKGTVEIRENGLFQIYDYIFKYILLWTTRYIENILYLFMRFFSRPTNAMHWKYVRTKIVVFRIIMALNECCYCCCCFIIWITSHSKMDLFGCGEKMNVSSATAQFHKYMQK